LGSAPVGDGTEGTDTDGAGTEGRGTDGTGTDGTGTGAAGVVTAGVVTAGVETRDGTLTVPEGVGMLTDGAETATEGTVVLGPERALAAPEASATAISTLSATERRMRIVRDMRAETHTETKTCANDARARIWAPDTSRPAAPKRSPTAPSPKSDCSTRYYERRAADDRRVSPL